MTITVAGAGAFGTAVAITLANEGHAVSLWARDAEAVAHMRQKRESPRLSGCELPDTITPSEHLNVAGEIALIAVPAQSLRAFLRSHSDVLAGKSIIACCKGIDLASLTGPVRSIVEEIPSATAAMLTGPSFAIDIAHGLPTALTLACADEDAGRRLQEKLSTRTLRLYRTTDTIGAELGGALKNVIAIASGATIGAGYGESARAAVMTRGFAEMQRLAEQLGADPQTLVGLSGFGDLALTCTSDLSRNYRYGLALGSGAGFDRDVTVEGVATAGALRKLAAKLNVDLPICETVAQLAGGETTTQDAMQALFARPLKEE